MDVAHSPSGYQKKTVCDVATHGSFVDDLKEDQSLKLVSLQYFFSG